MSGNSPRATEDAVTRTATIAAATSADDVAPHLGWRALALFYDFWPVLALWLLVATVFTVGFWLAGHPARENIRPDSALYVVEWLCCWLVTGAYATTSWRRGGQTLGMRPWRIRVTSADGAAPSRGVLWRRFAVGTLSLFALGAGFWWAFFDRDRLTWHDRVAGTRMVRTPRRA